LVSAQIGFACNHFRIPHLNAARRIWKGQSVTFQRAQTPLDLSKLNSECRAD